MHPSISEKTTEIPAICRRHGVRRLELFGSAARGSDFDPARSDADFLVELDPASTEGDPLLRWLDLEQDLTDLLGRPVDLIDRHTLEQSRNYIRRRAILRGVEPLYG